MVIIYSLENKYNPKLLTKISFTSPFAFTNLIINRFDTDKISVWGDGGYAIINLGSKETSNFSRIFKM